MKKILIGIVAALAIFSLVAPASADLKLTTTGYMEVNGIYISGNPGDINSKGGSSHGNDWYNMEMIVEPTLHINDKVRIHSQVRIMERNWQGTGRYETDPVNQVDTTNSKYDIFGYDQNNFWVERLYLSFPLVGGTLYVGRMAGGSFGYLFSDNDSNADRIRYVRKFGNVTLGYVYEKSAELDGGQNAPRASNLVVTNTDYDTADGDVDSHGLFAVVPLGKTALLRLLSWNVRDGRQTDNKWTNLMWACLGLNFGMLKIDTEFNFGYQSLEDQTLPNGDEDDVDVMQWAAWGELGITPGPFELWFGGFYIEGEDDDDPNKNDRVGTFWNVGRNYEPTLLLFSEDMGLIYGAVGVANGTGGSSGLYAAHVRGSYKLTDTMKLSAILQYVSLAEMEIDGVDEEIGYEFDVSFQWKFMPNLSYIVEAGYFAPGDYWKDSFDADEEVYGVRNTIRVEW